MVQKKYEQCFSQYNMKIPPQMHLRIADHVIIITNGIVGDRDGGGLGMGRVGA